jgi:hypothetical protein
MQSLGRRSPETEALLAEFNQNKQPAVDAVKSLASRLKDLARMNRALRINRVPKILCEIARRLDDAGLLGTQITIVGTNALYAYEARAGVFVPSNHLATGDLDVLYDARAKVSLSVEGYEPNSMLQLLKTIDPSFELLAPRSYSAVNGSAYAVDVIKAGEGLAGAPTGSSVGGPEDLQAAHIDNMRWMVAAPKFTAVAIGADGFPVPMVCPDPRAFTIYKTLMGTQDASREPLKRRRDLAQSEMVERLVREYFPDLPFKAELLKNFPKVAVTRFLRRADSTGGITPGFDP